MDKTKAFQDIVLGFGKHWHFFLDFQAFYWSNIFFRKELFYTTKIIEWHKTIPLNKLFLDRLLWNVIPLPLNLICGFLQHSHVPMQTVTLDTASVHRHNGYQLHWQTRHIRSHPFPKHINSQQLLILEWINMPKWLESARPTCQSSHPEPGQHVCLFDRPCVHTKEKHTRVHTQCATPTISRQHVADPHEWDSLGWLSREVQYSSQPELLTGSVDTALMCCWNQTSNCLPLAKQNKRSCANLFSASHEHNTGIANGGCK